MAKEGHYRWVGDISLGISIGAALYYVYSNMILWQTVFLFIAVAIYLYYDVMKRANRGEL